MTWTPETNRIPVGLLTPDELAALKAAEHGWEYYSGHEWGNIKPTWREDAVYRAKPAPPKRIVTHLHWYADWGHRRIDCEDSVRGRLRDFGGWAKRIECNEDGSDVVVTDVEEVK